MRKYLITKFACAECGSLLEISYEKPKSVAHVNGEPTGADRVDVALAIVPCQVCHQPIKDVRHAINTLMGIAKS